MRTLCLLTVLLTFACDTVEPGDAGYEDGCLDGVDFGYANGLMHGESCSAYDDDPGERYSEDGDSYEVSYNEGYTDCYPDGYADGYYEGDASTEC